MNGSRALLLLCFALAMSACAALLGIKPQSGEHPFEHRAHSLRGVSCVECHSNVAKAGDNDPLHLPDRATCVRCHQKPHDPGTCSSCHGDGRIRRQVGLAREHLRFSHATHVPTLGGQCVPCHAAAGEKMQTQLRPKMAQCFTCHAHQGQWTATQCDACHVDLPRESVRPQSHVIHDGNFVREHGVRAASARDLCASCHQERFCAGCHGTTVPVLPWRLDITRPTLSGLHRAGFRQRHADEARAAPGTCTSCHDAERYCADCHARERTASGLLGQNPHPPNWVRARGGEHGKAARMDPLSCASCHGGSGEALCVGCHRVGGPGGNPHGPGFSSSKEPRRDEPCKQCHAS